jgi:site-specific recombinase XerD
MHQVANTGTDVFTLAKLMGHEEITALQCYLKQINLDTDRPSASWFGGYYR